ncbi:MAG: hypothetical protein OYH76_10360 [Defluviicoccus sp.]|nr:hypothetical protein [Defluviicoccus sp.]MDE0276288.1 hypothetical protein [Defluviicoccus sp.]
MPKATRTGTDKLSTLIAEIEAEAYARGRAAARKEVLDALGAGGTAAPRSKASRGRKGRTAAAPRRRTSGGKRAPRGSVPRFVERVLRERPGLTPPEILAQAATDTERLIKLGSIRTELTNGRGQGRYELVDGRWSLAVPGPDPAKAVEIPSTGPTPGSEPGGEESRSTLGLNL